VIEPLRVSVEVDCGPEHAFGTWTARLGTWWPDDWPICGTSAGTGPTPPMLKSPLCPSTTAGRESTSSTPGWERVGAEGRSWRDANAGGWNGLLPHFAAACDGNDKEATS
jgi:hypothetical protein